MEENTNTELNDEINVDSNTDDGAVDNKDTETTKGKEDTKADEPFSITKEEYEKAIQSTEDKIRGKMSKEIKDLKAEIAKLTPVKKSDAEIALENRIAALEASEKEVAEKERKLAFQEQLSAKGLDKSLVDYLKDDADVETLSGIIENIVKSRAKSSGYIPGDHSSDDTITPEDYAKMSYSQKLEFSTKHPEAYKRLSGKR